MRNDNDRWTPPLGEDRAPVAGHDARLALCRIPRQTVLSGPIDSCLALAGLTGAVGWPDVASGARHAVRLRRDRILVCNGPDLADGWAEGPGVAVSDMTGGLAVLELSGAGSADILATGTELDPALASASAVRRFHRHEVILYHWQSDSTYRLHFHRGMLEYFWSLLAGLIEDRG